jgi:signal transduction histidine kinase
MNTPTERFDAQTPRVNGRAAGTFLSRITVDTPLRNPLWRLWKSGRKERRPNDEFMAILSHELRDSLGGIRCAASILRMNMSATPDVVKARMLIERQVDHMSRLIEDLMDISQMENGQLRLQHERVDLCVAVAQSVQAAELSMVQRSHRMTTSTPSAPIWIQADPVRLEQVFVNLLINAAKYTATGGSVEISVEQRGSEAIVGVRDTGIGIAPEVLPHIFELFVQASRSSSRARAGLGIGLALVRSLVERHGGRVSATSAGLGKGSVFTVHLPLSVQPSPTADASAPRS